MAELAYAYALGAYSLRIRGSNPLEGTHFHLYICANMNYGRQNASYTAKQTLIYKKRSVHDDSDTGIFDSFHFGD